MFRAKFCQSKSSHIQTYISVFFILPIPGAGRFTVWVRISPGHGWISSECCVLSEFSASSWLPFQRSPTEGGVPECGSDVSIMIRPWPTRGSCTMGNKYCFILNFRSLLFQPELDRRYAFGSHHSVKSVQLGWPRLYKLVCNIVMCVVAGPILKKGA